MSLRVLEGSSKAAFYNKLGLVDPFPSREDWRTVETGPQLYPFYQSLFKQAPFTYENRNMAVDGSVTPVRFSLDVPAGLVYVAHRIIFMLRDSVGIDVGGWGNSLGDPLTNGMTVGVTINGQDINFSPIPWTSCADLAAIAYDVSHNAWGQGDEFVSMRLTLTKAGTRLRLIGDRGDTFWMQVNDDLTYLTEQRCMVQGSIENAFLN